MCFAVLSFCSAINFTGFALVWVLLIPLAFYSDLSADYLSNTFLSGTWTRPYKPTRGWSPACQTVRQTRKCYDTCWQVLFADTPTRSVIYRRWYHCVLLEYRFRSVNARWNVTQTTKLLQFQTDPETQWNTVSECISSLSWHQLTVGSHRLETKRHCLLKSGHKAQQAPPDLGRTYSFLFDFCSPEIHVLYASTMLIISSDEGSVFYS